MCATYKLNMSVVTERDVMRFMKFLLIRNKIMIRLIFLYMNKVKLYKSEFADIHISRAL